MGFLDQITGLLGGHEPLERLARRQANFDDPQSPDFEHWNQLVGAAPPEYVHEATAQAVQRVDPQQMSPQEVASLANYLRQYHPEAFSRAAAQVGQQKPGLLQRLLGHKVLMLAAAGLAAKFLADRARSR
jgi:hypothetical protein